MNTLNLADVLEIGLFDAATDELITRIEDGELLSTDNLPALSDLTIAAILPGSGTPYKEAESAFIDFDNGDTTRTENSEPFALFGDRGGDFFVGDGIEVGEHTIEFNLFSEDDLQGNSLGTISRNFEIVEAVEPPPNTAVLSGTGDIAGIVELFRDVVDGGGVNNGNEAGSQGDGFREINWDGAAVPFNMPANFFNNPNPPVNGLPRGVEFDTESAISVFGVSNPIFTADPFFGDDEFDTLNPGYPEEFATFSSPRLFSPLDSNVMTVEFVEPGVFDKNGDPVSAPVSGFGAIFTDVDLPDSTKLEFFDGVGDLLFSQYVEPDPQGLSFAGVAFDEPLLAKVRITSGTTPLIQGLDDNPGKGVDIVAMDNFIYGEPIVPALV
ncbi:MAG: hypothetical protein AAF974_02855 [Cyanobacteria bacterium P01_E01_bin.34]